MPNSNVDHEESPAYRGHKMWSGIRASFRQPPSRQGYALVKLSVILVVIIIAVMAAMRYVRIAGTADLCEENLHEIYAALELYDVEKGGLPRLAFYPDDPKEAEGSLLTVVREYGAREDACVCLRTPRRIRQTGLSYVWNVTLNGRRLGELQHDPDWMLVEINALSRNVSAPHMGRYNILYSDGRVIRSDLPPAGLRSETD